MDRGETKILLRVATQFDENSNHLKSKGLSAMFVSRQLVEPKCTANLSARKVNRSIFRYYGGTRGNASQTRDASG